MKREIIVLLVFVCSFESCRKIYDNYYPVPVVYQQRMAMNGDTLKFIQNMHIDYDSTCKGVVHLVLNTDNALAGAEVDILTPVAIGAGLNVTVLQGGVCIDNTAKGNVPAVRNVPWRIKIVYFGKDSALGNVFNAEVYN